MATVDRQHDSLQTIFSFFLGLMVVAFVGVGVNTFYPSPSTPYTDYSVVQPLMDTWSRNTSIILVLFATAVMGISLIRADQLKVVSNGLLLGGLFTMLYGAGWTIFSGTSYLRFLVVLFALAVAIGLGYAKFVWLRTETPAVAGSVSGASPGAGAGVAPADVSGLAARVAALEAKTDAAAAALGRREGD
jgi:hypothetical protein